MHILNLIADLVIMICLCIANFLVQVYFTLCFVVFVICLCFTILFVWPGFMYCAPKRILYSEFAGT